MAILTTVNSSLRKKITEEQVATFIKNNILPEEYREHMYVFFTEVPVSAIFRFILEQDITLDELRTYYITHIQRLYRNKDLEELFSV